MPIRAIVLKLIVPRSSAPEATATRRALWRTHAEVNAATAHYERSLLAFRGAGYQTANAAISNEDARATLITIARQAQVTNLARTGAPITLVHRLGDNGHLVALLTELYAAIVPTIQGKNGSAQVANGFVSPLTDPASGAFMNASLKLNRPVPEWLGLVDGNDPACLNEANAWFASETSAAWRFDTGSPATWLRKANAGDPAWPQSFADKLAELREETQDGHAGLMTRLRALHLLPLFPAYFKGRIANSEAAVTPWDRLAFRLAVAHLLSWESWNWRAAAEHARQAAILTKFRSDHLTADTTARIEALHGFEQQCSAHLPTQGLGAPGYRLTRGQLRNWPDLRERWLKLGSIDPTELMEVAKIEQTGPWGRPGNLDVFAWLSATNNQHIWRAEPDAVSLLATLNAMEAVVARSRESALMTFPDPVTHPRAVQWSAVGDTNFRPYRLLIDEDGKCQAALRLLVPRKDDDLLDDDKHTLLLAPSKQFRKPIASMRGRKAAIRFETAGVDMLSGVVGSADLLLDRHHLKWRPIQALAAGDIGPSWLKLSLDLDLMPREGWIKDAARFVNHFRSAAGKVTSHESRVVPGARVLSVDLGVSTFAACSVFTLVDIQPAAHRFTLPVAVGERTLWAVHERSFHLTLPGEVVGRDGEEWRRGQNDQLLRLRRALFRYRLVLHLGKVAAADRAIALQGLRTAQEKGGPFSFEAELLMHLVRHIEAPGPVWDTIVDAMLQRFRIEMGAIIKAWRREGRARAADRHSGPSMWAIQHLSDIRHLLLSWSLMVRRRGDVRRQNQAARGVFASRLFSHVDAIKENRLKTGADMIVQAARGYLRDKAGHWQRMHPACDLVLFEDLTRYRMLTDRPLRERSQLMLWAHRAMPAKVAMQGELYGLEIADTSAAFSSRYHARSMTPGIRCRALTKADFSDLLLRERLALDDFVLEALRPGDLVPFEGGEVFVCQRANGGLSRIDADINAAQNLQLRFWSRHAEALQIPCRSGNLGGRSIFVPRSFGRRLLGAMGSQGVLESIGSDTPACRWRPMKLAEFRSLGLDAGRDDTAVEVRDSGDEEELHGLADAAAELSGKVEVMFRDPSGVALPSDCWYPQKIFWSVVRSRLLRTLRPLLAKT